MTVYVKLDANYEDDPAILEAGEKAELLFIRGLALAKRTLSDGFIADVQLAKFGLSGVKTRAERLRSVGLWVRDDDRNGYWIAGWAKWNRSRSEVEEIRNKRREAGRRGGKASGEARREANAKQSASANAKQPSNPETETETETEEVQGVTSAPADAREEAKARFEEHFWPVYPPTNGVKRDKGKALQQWLKLTIADQRAAVIGARNKRHHFEQTGEQPPYAFRFLRDRAFEDFLEAPTFDRDGNVRPLRVPTCPDCNQEMASHDDDTCELVKDLA